MRERVTPRLCLLLTAVGRARVVGVDVGGVPSLGGVNVIIDANNVAIYEQSNTLPLLPAGVRTVSYGALPNARWDGIISVGATLSLDRQNRFFNYGKAVRRSIQIFLDYVNSEARG